MGLSSRVRQFCSEHQLRLNTDLGQHFLVDETVLEAIVENSGLKPDETALEIGPGVGVLTEQLLGRAKKVIAIEVDPRMIPLLAMFTSRGGSVHPGLEIIHGNALQVPFPTAPYRIVANIPYHITSPLLRHAFLESPLPPISATLLIQREVAERICEEEDRGLLTIVVALFGKPRIVMNVPPTAFLPPPAVDSAVLHIDCYKEPLVDTKTLQKVLTLAKVGFAQKRKMISNSLGSLPGGEEALKAAGIESTRRPQMLSVEEWIAVAHAYTEIAGA